MHDEKNKNDYGDHLLSHQPVPAILNKALISLNNLQKTDHVSPGPHLGKQKVGSPMYSKSLLNTLSEWVSEVAQSCPTLCDPVDCSPPGSSVHGILQARILEWVAISFSRGSSHPRDRTHVSELQADALTSEPSGKPLMNTLRVTKSKVWENGSGSSTALSLLADETWWRPRFLTLCRDVRTHAQNTQHGWKLHRYLRSFCDG